MTESVRLPDRVGWVVERLRPHAEWLPVLAVTAAAGLLGGYRLGSKSFWLDEAISAEVAGYGLPGLLNTISGRDMNMGPYYVLLSAWSTLGTSESALRSLSVLAGVLALPVFYLLARRLLSMPLALFATSLLGTSGFFVHYLQEARGYTLALLVVVLASHALVRAIEVPSRLRWLAYGLLAALSIYAHFMSALVVAGQLIALIGHRERGRLWRPALAGVGLLVILCLPVAVTVAGGGNRLGWIGPLSLGQLEGGLRALAGRSSTEVAWIVLLAWVVGALVALRRWQLGGHWLNVLAVTWAAVPILGLLAAALVQPLFVPRFLLMALPGVCLLAAIAVGALGFRPLMAAAAVALLAVSLSGSVDWLTEARKPQWREASRFVLRNVAPDDGLVFFEPFAVRVFNYYAQRHEAPAPRRLGLPLTAAAGMPSAELDRRLCEASRTTSRIWLVRSHISAGSRERLAWLIEHLERYYQRAQRRTFTAIVVYVYEVSPGSGAACPAASSGR